MDMLYGEQITLEEMYALYELGFEFTIKNGVVVNVEYAG